MHDFCTGKYAGNDYERHSCIKTYAKEVGHDMIPGDQQALESYRKATAGVQKSKANRKDPADKQAPQDTGTVQQAPPLSDHYSINDVPPTHR